MVSDHFPSQLSTGVTAGWLIEANKSIKKVLASDVSGLKLPVLFFTAGDDIVVNSESAKKICKKIPNCRNNHYKKGKHQLLVETDDILDDLFIKIKNFL